MSYSRSIDPATSLRGTDLTEAMVAIGMGFGAPPALDPNIEDTVYFASVDGMDHDDLRALSVLVTWLEVHSSWLNADRLTKVVGNGGSPRVRAFWAAIARWRGSDSRFARLARMREPGRVDLIEAGGALLVRRHGEDGRFADGPLRVPGNVLRDRKVDVMSPAQLAARHGAFRWRVVIGPSYRADMWAALELEPGLSAAELARRTYGSFSTAWHVRRDYAILRESRG